MLQFMGSQRVRHELATEQQQQQHMCINSEMITEVELINISSHIVTFFVMRASEISSQ